MSKPKSAVTYYRMAKVHCSLAYQTWLNTNSVVWPENVKHAQNIYIPPATTPIQYCNHGVNVIHYI